MLKILLITMCCCCVAFSSSPNDFEVAQPNDFEVAQVYIQKLKVAMPGISEDCFFNLCAEYETKAMNLEDEMYYFVNNKWLVECPVDELNEYIGQGTAVNLVGSINDWLRVYKGRFNWFLDDGLNTGKMSVYKHEEFLKLIREPRVAFDSFDLLRALDYSIALERAGMRAVPHVAGVDGRLSRASSPTRVRHTPGSTAARLQKKLAAREAAATPYQSSVCVDDAVAASPLLSSAATAAAAVGEKQKRRSRKNRKPSAAATLTPHEPSTATMTDLSDDDDIVREPVAQAAMAGREMKEIVAGLTTS